MLTGFDDAVDDVGGGGGGATGGEGALFGLLGEGSESLEEGEGAPRGM